MPHVIPAQSGPALRALGISRAIIPPEPRRWLVFDTMGILVPIRWAREGNSTRWAPCDPCSFEWDASELCIAAIAAMPLDGHKVECMVLPPRAASAWVSYRGAPLTRKMIELTTSRPPKGLAGIRVNAEFHDLDEDRAAGLAEATEKALRYFVSLSFDCPWRAQGRLPDFPAVEDAYRSIDWMRRRCVATPSVSNARPVATQVMAGLRSLEGILAADQVVPGQGSRRA